MTVCPTPGKHAHKSLPAALAARESLERTRGVDLTLRPYECVCGSWHLGHRTPPLNRQLRNSLRVGKAISLRRRA